MDVTKSVALEMDVEPILSTKYLVIRKNQFDKNNKDEEIQSVAKSFRVNYFLVVIDMTITSLKNIFEQLKTFESIFGFLFNSNKLKFLDDDDNKLREHCACVHSTFSKCSLSEILIQKIFSSN